MSDAGWPILCAFAKAGPPAGASLLAGVERWGIAQSATAFFGIPRKRVILTEVFAHFAKTQWRDLLLLLQFVHTHPSEFTI